MSFFRAHRPAFLGLLPLLAASACGDLVGTDPGTRPAPPALAVLKCQAEVSSRTVSCAGPAPEALRSAHIVGGQGINVRLTSTNVSYSAATRIFGFDVTVQNLLAQRMGTPNGSAATGVRVFMHSEPAATGGTGDVEVANADGEGVFTGAAQPFYLYPEILPYQAVSGVRRWEFEVDPTVTSFAFSVYVAADLLPVVVFDRAVGGNRDIYRIAIDGSDLVRLTTNAGDDRDATVGGNAVVFTSFRSGSGDLYSVPLTGGTEVRLTTSSVRETDPSLSSDGVQLAYAREVNGMNRLFTALRATPTAVTAITPENTLAIEGTASWSPNGDLAYMSTARGAADIWRLPLGGSPTLLVGTGRPEVEPVYSPDGNRVAFARDLDGTTDLYLVNVSTGTETRLTSRAGGDYSPSWLNDGRIVYVCSTVAPTVRNLCIMDPANPAGAVQIETGGEVYRPMAVPF